MTVCSINDVELGFTVTGNDYNTIYVENRNEVFFDVFECAVGESNILLERVDTHENGPIVLFEVTINGKRYSTNAVLIDSNSTYLEINEDLLHAIREQSNIFKEEVEIEDSETKSTSNLQYINVKEDFLNGIEEQFEGKISNLKEDISEKLDIFFDKIKDTEQGLVKEKIDELSTELDGKFVELKSDLNEVGEFSKKNINSIVEKKLTDVDEAVSFFFQKLTDEHREKFVDYDSGITAVNSNLRKLEEKIATSNKTIYDKFTDSSKSVSDRFNELTALRDQLDVYNKASTKENKELFEFMQEKLDTIDSKFKNLSEEESKKYDELLAAVNNKDVVEYKTILKEKIQDVELTQIKESLQEEISSALKGDIVSLKRYVEMSSGGGSVAKQFAAGGTMDGTLNVNGNILSGGTNLIDIFNSDTSINLQDVTDNGNTTTNLISSNNTIIADTIIATNLLSATNLDIGFELSGFNVTGSLSASGNISSGSLTTPALSTDGINTEFTGNATINGKILGGNNAQFESGDTTYSVILGGDTNTVSGSAAAIVGGICNTVSGNLASILGGKCNTASGCRTVITGGSCNIAHGNRTFVGGGSINALSGNCSAIVGGLRNTVTGDYSSIVGGLSSKAIGNHSFIGGGNNNVACGVRSTIGGGSFNIASGDCSTIFGGKSNVASGNQAGVFGGTSNTAAHGNSFIIGDSLTSSQICTTFVNNLSAQCSLYAGNGATIQGSINVGSLSASGNLSGANIVGNNVFSGGLAVCTSVPAQTIPTLQAVTDEGNTTTGSINVGSCINFGDRASDDVLIRAESDANDLTLIRAASFADSVGVSLKYIGSGTGDENIFEITTDGGGSLKIDNSGDVGINTAPVDGKDLTADEVVVNTNLGIGTSTPSEALDVTGNIKASGSITGTLSTAAQPNITSIGTLTSLNVSGSLSASGSNPNYFAGNVGIGNNSPAKNLHITHSSSPTIRFARDLSYYWDIGHTGSDFQFTSQIPGVVMHMNYDGNVGIATTDPQTKLHVDEGMILADGSSTNHGFELRRDNFDTFQMRHLGGNFTIRNFTDNRTDLSIDGAGKVGIGSSVPNEKLTVAGNISASGNIFSAGLAVCTSVPAQTIPSLQQVTTQGNTTTNSISIGELSASKITGGISNRAFGVNAAGILGGVSNTASGARSSIVGGYGNTASGYGSSVGNGYNSTASGNYSAIVSGRSAYAVGHYSFIGGSGYQNRAKCSNSFIGNGIYNCTNGYQSSVVNGYYNHALGNLSSVVGGTRNQACASKSSVVGGSYNCAIGVYSSIVGGSNNRASGINSFIAGGNLNCVNVGHNCSFIIGTGITSNAACTTFVNNLSSQGIVNGCSITSYEGVKVGSGSIISCNASFTPSLSDNGRTLLLDTTSGSIVVTVTPQISGFTTRYIKEAGAAPVVFSTGTGLSGLYSYQDRNQMSIIYAQADIFFKSNNYAFLGGNLQ